MFIQVIINALVQVILFAAIPYLYWLIKYRKEEKFLVWIGLKKAVFSSNKRALLFSVLSFAILLSSGILLLSIIDDKSILANAQFASMGLGSILLVLVYAIVQTGLSEEVLFRGFLLKRFANRWGFVAANGIQASLFGLLHGVTLFQILTPFLVIVIIIFSALAGWIMGYLNERIGNGSILPSWIIHSVMNITSSLLIAFNLMKY